MCDEFLFCKEELLPLASHNLSHESQLCSSFLYVISDNENMVEDEVTSRHSAPFQTQSPIPSATYSPLPPSQGGFPSIPMDVSIVTPCTKSYEYRSCRKRHFGSKNTLFTQDDNIAKRASKRCKERHNSSTHNKAIPLPRASRSLEQAQPNTCLSSKYEHASFLPSNIVTPIKNNIKSFDSPILHPYLEYPSKHSFEVKENIYDWDSLELEDIPLLIPESLCDDDQLIGNEKPTLPDAVLSSNGLSPLRNPEGCKTIVDYDHFIHNEKPIVPEAALLSNGLSLVTPCTKSYEYRSCPKRYFYRKNALFPQDDNIAKRASKRCKVRHNSSAHYKAIPLPNASRSLKQAQPSMRLTSKHEHVSFPSNIVTPIKNNRKNCDSPILHPYREYPSKHSFEVKENTFDWDSLKLEDILVLIPESLFDDDQLIGNEKPTLPDAILSSNGLSPLHKPQECKAPVTQNHDFFLSGLELEEDMGDFDFSLSLM